MASPEETPVSEDTGTAQPEQEEPKPQVSFKKNKRITGTVKWFNAKSGFGFITRHDTGEDVFVHHSSIRKPNRHQITKSLGDGEIVEFSLIASKVTGPGSKPVKGSRFVAIRGRRRSRASSRASHMADKDSISRVDTVGDGVQEIETRTKKLSVQSAKDETKTENAPKQVHFEERGDITYETVSSNTTIEYEE